MRARPGAWLLGCMLTIAGCIESPTVEPAPEPTEEIHQVSPPRAVQAVHHARQQVSPVLTWRQSPSPTVPMTLTASDGTGLDLVSMKARVVIEDPLAFTELHLTFDNPEPRRREGRFEIELPPGAALSRLAMKIRGQFQEGEVVERAKAQRTYETFMHRRPKVDPALLEKEAGNRVQARVFPILPHERKEIIVSFSQELGASPYRLPLQGLSTIEDFDARVVVKTHEGARDRSSLSGAMSAQRVVELQRSHFTPQKDLVVELDGASEAAGLHAGDLAIVRVRPRADRPASRPESLLVLFDTSASAGVGFEDRVERLGAALGELAEARDFELRLVAFDQSVHTVFEGKGSQLGVDTLADLVEGRALGASNLEQALTTVAGLKGRWDRALLVSDGVATAGRTDRGSLRMAARGLEAVGVRRMDALAPGAREDRELLGDLTTALPEPGVILDDEATTASISEGLSQAPFGDVAITVDGATWSWPRSLQGTGPGEDVLVFAHYEGARPPIVRVMFSDPSIATQEVETLEVERPLVERAWAQARIDRIEHEKARVATSKPSALVDLDARIVELSTHYRVLTDLTALLVLETENDYRRFGIDRRGKADIITVDGGSVRLQRRSAGTRESLAMAVADDLAAIEDEVIEEPPEEEPPVVAMEGERSPDSSILELMAHQSGQNLGLVGTGRGGGGFGEGTIGLDEHGLIGHGGGGTGSGYGRGAGAGFDDGTLGLGSIGAVGGTWSGPGFGPGIGGPSTWGATDRRTAVPQVRQARATVQGSIDKDIIRRIMRAHINEVRHCYNQGLMRNPSLSGRVSVAFTIGATGTVVTSGLESSTVSDASVGACISKAVRRWKFPKPPGGGVVQVVAPLLLSSDGVRMPGPSPWQARRQWWGPPPKPRRRAKAPHSGRFAQAQRLLAANQTDDAYDLAWDWVQTQPGDTLGLLALGEALEQRGRPALAARVYGSLIDLHPSRVDVRRAAGQRLERLGEPGLALAIDSYEKAVEARPDHPSGARLLAWALVKQGRHERAFEVLQAARHRRYPSGRFAGVKNVLQQDQAVVAAAWLVAGSEADQQDARRRLAEKGIEPATTASTRFVATWETDTTDVDLTLQVPGQKRRRGRRIADVTTGYGPEARVLTGSKMPPRLRATVQYYDRKAMGHAMGTLQIVAHDGNGGIRVQAQPFVLMEQGGSLALGAFDTGVEPGLNAS